MYSSSLVSCCVVSSLYLRDERLALFNFTPLYGHSPTAWRLESSLREFENIDPVNFWFEYPIHRLDTTSDLSGCGAE